MDPRTTTDATSTGPAGARRGRFCSRAAAGVAAAALLVTMAAPAASAASTGPAPAPSQSLASAPAPAPAPAASMAPAASNDEVVARWYVDFLGRSQREAEDDRGRQYWVRQLDAGAAREEVLGEITRSPEFARVAVREVYTRVLRREPDPGAGYWIERVPRGMAVEWVEQNVLASPEFGGGSEPGEYWVGYLYFEILGREAQAGEVSYWRGRYPDLGALGLVRAIWYSPEAVGRRLVDTHLDLLGRGATRGEVDDLRRAEATSDLGVRITIACSPEYTRAVISDDPGTASAAAAAVKTFLDTLGAGRPREAFAQLSPETQAGIGGYEGFTSREGPAQLLSGFSTVALQRYQVHVVDESSTVVALFRPRIFYANTASLGVRRVVDGGRESLRIDLPFPSVNLSLLSNYRLAPGEPITVTVDRRGQRATVGVLIDGRYIGPEPDAAQSATEFTLNPGLLAPGQHVVTAYARTDTVLQVNSQVYDVR